MEKATFAAGCFWGVELLFSKIEGVQSTRVGYIGGETENPTYEDVCRSATGHAEATEIIFNPNIVSYKELLKVFWDNHNPTTLNRQGPDIGSQYRSAILYHNQNQKKEAIMLKDQLENSNKYKEPIVTEIVEATTFYTAEEYHQKYLEKRGSSNCSI